VKEEAKNRIAAGVRGIMETPPPFWSGVPLRVDIKAGSTLAEEDMHKL
jgi:hypothetical protein